jgi:hypothetical protein
MWTQVMKYSDPFMRLRKSRFRRSFHLDAVERAMVDKLGLEVVKEHASRIVRERLNNPAEDGKQTPYRGHPVFKAQHATATCCRRCLFRWHRIPYFRELTGEEIDYVVGLVVRWVRKELIVR